MSNCAHRQSEYKLTAFPRCQKCKLEMIMVSVMYDKELTYEWECDKCLKTFPIKKFNIKWTKQDIKLSKKVNNVKN